MPWYVVAIVVVAHWPIWYAVFYGIMKAVGWWFYYDDGTPKSWWRSG